ncbi:steroidogenic factor 1-like [Cheilinus undulatus]|uniref:steroidogenic factor 1-like n=1 Tax=Cheilinus undulatus TaxID=241271 RepID=UPI001BD64212|nr:steroidogenic factor 1-like [Cheilinus undulatus]
MFELWVLPGWILQIGAEIFSIWSEFTGGQSICGDVGGFTDGGDAAVSEIIERSKPTVLSLEQKVFPPGRTELIFSSRSRLIQLIPRFVRVILAKTACFLSSCSLTERMEAVSKLVGHSKEDWKQVEELCPVCGDKVSGYHYGLLTCESCKGFFKRTVQNKKRYVCAEYQECRIDKSQRKRCPFCRFQKCLHVGMRLEAVRADRMRGGRNRFGPMYKRDRALKQQRRALVQGGGFRTERAPPLSVYGDPMFTADLHPAPALQTAQSQFFSLQPPSLGPLLPPLSPVAPSMKCEPPSTDSSVPAAGLTPEQPLPLPLSPQLVVELLQGGPDELQLQEKISARLLQEQMRWGGHWTPSTFSLMFIMADQMLLCTVEWARSCCFFKQLQVGDQMKLLHRCWTDLLLLDVVCRQVLFGREERLLLVSGQEVELSDVSPHADPALSGLIHRGEQLVQRLKVLKVHLQEFTWIRFLLLFDPEVEHLEDRPFVESVHQQVRGALLDHAVSSSSLLSGRFSVLLQWLSELRLLSGSAADYLYGSHLNAELHGDSLLLEMLHARRHQT